MTMVFVLVSDQTFKAFRHANSYDCGVCLDAQNREPFGLFATIA